MSGPHFLQIPGPAPEPPAALDAISRPTIDHRGPEFQELGRDVLDRVRAVFRTEDPVVIYSGSGTGAWEAALVNTMNLGSSVLFCETGHFSQTWVRMAQALGLQVSVVPGDWRHGIDLDVLQQTLEADSDHRISAVCCVHNETSTGVTNDIAAVRRTIDRAGHPALLLVDTISGVASADYRHDDWGVDVSIASSQKGLMLPPGLGFNVLGARALEAHEHATFPRSYWDWSDHLAFNGDGYWPSTPSTNLLYGLQAVLNLIEDEGLDAVLARHVRWATATRAAARAWGLELVCLEPNCYSPVLTAVMLPEGYDADELRRVVLDRFDVSLGAGLGKLAGRAFRIGHLGWINDTTLLGALSAVQMGLDLVGVPTSGDGMVAARAALITD